MSWRDDLKAVKPLLDGVGGSDLDSDFLNLSDGDSEQVVFLHGKWFARQRRWDTIDQRSKFLEEIANGNEQGPNGQPRYNRVKTTFSMNLYLPASDRVVIFEANGTTAQLIEQTFELIDGPGRHVFTLSRKGSKMDTTYHLKKELDLDEANKQQIVEISRARAHDLEDIQGYRLVSSDPAFATPAQAPVAQAPVAQSPVAQAPVAQSMVVPSNGSGSDKPQVFGGKETDIPSAF